jgi:hypothetical protein
VLLSGSRRSVLLAERLRRRHGDGDDPDHGSGRPLLPYSARGRHAGGRRGGRGEQLPCSAGRVQVARPTW